MNFKRVVRSIKKDGLRQTYSKHQEIKEKKKRISEITGFLEDGKIRVAAFVNDALKLPVTEVYDVLRAVIDKYISYEDEIESEPSLKEPADQLLQAIRKAEQIPGYAKFMVKRYIKECLPAAYDSCRFQPIEKKAVFLQQRKGLNMSCRYMKKYIDKREIYSTELHELRMGDYPLVYYYEKACVFARSAATAKVIFVHNQNDLLAYMKIREETKVVQLWHGCGLYKKVGMSIAGKPRRKTLEDYEEYPVSNNYSMVTVASPALIWIYEEFMGIDADAGIIQPIGVSRTDEFFNEGYMERSYRKLHKRIPEAREKKEILYAPTFRGEEPNRYAPDRIDLEYLYNQLKDDFILIIKHHQTLKSRPPIDPRYEGFAFDMTKGKGMNINELMTTADMLITDYSSVAFEFSLFERPIIFFSYDLDEYEAERGLYDGYDDMTPGPIVRTNEELANTIRAMAREFDKTEIREFRRKYMSACDGHATERILHYVETGELTYPKSE